VIWLEGVCAYIEANDSNDEASICLGTADGNAEAAEHPDREGVSSVSVKLFLAAMACVLSACVSDAPSGKHLRGGATDKASFLFADQPSAVTRWLADGPWIEGRPGAWQSESRMFSPSGVDLLPTKGTLMSNLTVVLVHGAFADGSSWNGVIEILQKNGYHVAAVSNPLRSVAGDAAYVSDILGSMKGPIVLVGHSYGGAVISAAANGHPNVKSLVYVGAFAPDTGETAAELSGKFPGGTLGSALADPVQLTDGGADLYIDQAKFHRQFAHDLPAEKAALMAAGQRPITEAALNEKAGEPAWKTLPSWFVYGDGDKNIPAAALEFMAERAGSKRTVVIEGASHVVMISQPQAVSDVIEEAAGVLRNR
jgi:pimeloyl-ACP methyl ester carboxylesterase